MLMPTNKQGVRRWTGEECGVGSGDGSEAGTRYKDLGLAVLVELGLTGRLPIDGAVVGVRGVCGEWGDTHL